MPDEMRSEPIEAVASRPQQVRPGYILLVEDNPDLSLLMQRHLSRAGHRVATAEDGVAALAEVERAARSGCPHDLILMDMQMPEMDGYSVTKKLRCETGC